MNRPGSSGPGSSGRADRKSADDGLQAERTSLSWSRTSLGLLANGSLLLLKDAFEFAVSVRLLPAVLAAAVAVLTYAVGVQRQRTLRRRPLPADVAVPGRIRLIGVSVIVLIVVTAAALLL